MRIAFIVDQFPVLSETFILGQITGLIDRGHEVDIYCDRLGDTKNTHPEIQQYQLLQRTYYTPIPSNLLIRVFKAIWLFLSNFLKSPQVLLRAINFLKYNRALYGDVAGFLKPLYLAVPWLNQPPYDVLLCHYGRNGLKATLFKDLGVIDSKIVTIFHGYDLSHYMGIHGEQIYRHLFQRVDLLLPISQHWQKKLIALGCKSEKIRVHRMGINCDRFEYVKSSPNKPKIILVSVARLVEKKGLKYSIQAVASLISQYPSLEYQIVGDGFLRQELQHLIDHLNVGNNVKLLGWKKQAEVAAIISQANIVLAPSVTAGDGDCEGIPVSLMESMAKGLPVISTLHSGIPELIEDKVSGYLLPERDTIQLAHKIEYLLNDLTLRTKMGKAGRKKVQEAYNIDLLNDQLVQIFQQLINNER